jgi:hypothetical protein
VLRGLQIRTTHFKEDPMRRAILISTAVLAAAALATGTAEARLDPGFGTEGVATLTPPLPPGWSNEGIDAVATGQNGETYVVAGQTNCPGAPHCVGGDFVFRYLTNGAPEPTFAGSHGFEIPPEIEAQYGPGAPLITVDSTGLPVVGRLVRASTGGARAIVVRRLLEDGELDTSFGAGGGVRLPCPCEEAKTQLLAGPQGSIFIVATSLTRKKRKGQKNGVTGAATLIKLDSSGHRASGFGLRGSVTATMPGEGEIEYDGITPAGATYFGGRGLTRSTDSGFLVRVSSKGKIDTRFTQRAQKSLRRLTRVPGNEVRVAAAVVGRKGPIELFGSAGSIGGFELRLNQNGTLRRGWAAKGLALLPFAIVAAVQGREGSTMALTGEEAAPPRLLRILSDGKLDPVFGKTGETLPGATDETGVSLFPAGIGRVGVTDLDLRECRQACESTPKIYRYLEGR